MFSGDESTFAHDCSGSRIVTKYRSGQQYLMDPHSQSLRQKWRRLARNAQQEHFTALFADDAVGDRYAQGAPCNYDLAEWIHAMADAQQSVGFPVVYSGLDDFYKHGVAREIALNATGIGGMMEQCYAQSPPRSLAGGWTWSAIENTELAMASDQKFFFCYGNDLTPADQAVSQRTYVYASFLLTYDLKTSVLWEYYKTASGGHVMPESELVALRPVTSNVRTIEQLRNRDGVYTREYRECFIAGQPQGPCVAAVNPDPAAAHPLQLGGFRRTLELHGSGIFDGGSVHVSSQAPPRSLGPLQAVIAF
jgi:hypothetical protein